MADLSFLNIDQNIDDIRKIIEAEENAKPPRKYIGASSIGDECSRKIWYQYNGFVGLPIESKGLFAIEDGHRTEELIVSRFRKLPYIQLWTHKDDGTQYGFQWPELSGHYDGVIKGLRQAPETAHIFEVKCVNEKKFNELKNLKQDFGERRALRKWDKTYYAQACVYMYAEKLTRHYLVCATPGGRDMISVRTEADDVYAKALVDKARRIKEATEPPERIGGKDWWECRFCRFREVCHEA